jgi:hypothetical protein
MKKYFLLLLLFLVSCAQLNSPKVSPNFRENVKEGFKIEVTSEPKDLENLLKEYATERFSLLVPVLREGDVNVIKISFTTKGRLTTDADAKDAFSERTDTLPGKRHIFQSSEMNLVITDKNGEEIYKVKYKYEGRNDYKAKYTQTSEEAMEECLNRIVKIFEKDLKGKEK